MIAHLPIPEEPDWFSQLFQKLRSEIQKAIELDHDTSTIERRIEHEYASGTILGCQYEMLMRYILENR